MLRPLLNSVLLGSLVVGFVACAASSDRTGFENAPAPAASTPDQGTPATPGGDFGKQNPPAPPDVAEVHEVYGHSATTLYKLDPVSKAVSVIGDFSDGAKIIDIALDEKSNLFGVSLNVLYTIDKNTAKCTEIKTGNYPNSLSFVPKGTVDANEEALVGYDLGNYVRIDVKTGGVTTIGKLGGNLESSGDIVSVKGGKTFLTVKGGSCTKNDCLVEVDPANGKMLKNWGSIEHSKVFGLSFWGGKVYGFDESGNLFEVTFGTNQLATTPISIPQKPTDLSFWGAGSSTSAPLVVDPQ